MNRIFVVFLNQEVSCFYYEQYKAENKVNAYRKEGQSSWMQDVQHGGDFKNTVAPAE